MNRFALIAFSLLLSGALCRADTNPVRTELAETIKKIKATLKDHASVKLGEFNGHAGIQTNYGNNIVLILGKELIAAGIRVDPADEIQIEGDYRPAVVAPDSRQPRELRTCISLNIRIVNSNTGKSINGFSSDPLSIFGETALTPMLAVNYSIPPNANAKQADEIIRTAYQTPNYQTADSKIKATADSPFAVEVLVSNDKNETRLQGAGVLRTKQGLPYVLVQRGQFYRLKVFNNADYEVGVRIAIDGIDQFAFSDAPKFRKEDGSPKYSYRILSAHSSMIVSGWFRNQESFDFFTVTDYLQSAAAELKRGENEVGQISLEFHACWEKDGTLPADEPKDARSPLATGREPGGKEQTTEVQRTFGVLRDSIGLRYGNQVPQ